MKHLLKILDITGGDIARYAGITRQAVKQGSKRVKAATRVLVSSARLDPEKMEAARQARDELDEFFDGD